MTLGARLDDLGIPLPNTPTPTAPSPARPTSGPDPLIPGSPLARMLYEVWSGRPITVVDSPPGAGKTTLVVDAVTQLARRSQLRIEIAAPTRRGAIDLAARLSGPLAPTPDGTPRVGLAMVPKAHEVIPDAVTTVPTGRQSVTIRTLASARLDPPTCDVFVVDEAYQTVFADVALAADHAHQILLVGDPGQIGPVQQSDTSVWTGMRAAPCHRAPEVFTQADDALALRLPATYRLGPATTAAIAPLYDFPFGSLRPERHLTHHGTHLPEITTTHITPAGDDGEFDLAALSRVAEIAAGYIGATLTGPDTHLIEQADIAVVVARSGQEAALKALLRRTSTPAHDITVGTADRLQGGQWPVVVALDPLVGAADVDGFRGGPGRLCVMASRHSTHLHWIHDGRWPALLTEATRSDDERRAAEARTGLAVRNALTAPHSTGA